MRAARCAIATSGAQRAADKNRAKNRIFNAYRRFCHGFLAQARSASEEVEDVLRA
jgi:hypothetical protein